MDRGVVWTSRRGCTVSGGWIGGGFWDAYQYLAYYSIKSNFDKTGYWHFVVIVDLGLKTTKVLGAKVKEFGDEQAERGQMQWPMPAAEKREIEGEQAGTGQPATRPESDSEGGEKPQPEAEGRSR
jgi:hypothetical protein